MNLIFYVEARYIKDDAGNIYNEEGVLKFPLWQRYLRVFDHVTIVARVRHVSGYIGKDMHRANGANVTFFELPYFYGPLDFLKKRREITERIKDSTELSGSFLLRVPGQIGTIAAKYLTKAKTKYGVEVVGDPYDVFSKGAVKHPLRIFFKYKYYSDLKNVVSGASSALYVTKDALQKRYHPRKGAFTTCASNVILKEGYIKANSRIFGCEKKLIKIISIGSLEQMYKAPDVLLKSIKEINESQRRYRVSLVWIGAGKYQEEMKRLAKKLNVESDVCFKGYISDKNEIISLLDQSDLFVLASRTEGLPRVVIEAMARGLPVIGTRVGGIPELISERLLVEKNSPNALASKIKYIIDNPEIATDEARKNLENSKDYSEGILEMRRRDFYCSLK